MSATVSPGNRRSRLAYRYWRRRPGLDRWLVAAGLGPGGIHPAANPEPDCDQEMAGWRCQRKWRRHRTHVCVRDDLVLSWRGYDR